MDMLTIFTGNICVQTNLHVFYDYNLLDNQKVLTFSNY